VLQEDLGDARDSLVGSRFRLRTRRRQLQTTHEQAVSQVGETSELMRRYLLSNELDLPNDLRSAWSRVDATRDTLGGLDADFEEEEENYNKEDWQYTLKERNFVESLSGDTTAFITLHDAVAPSDLSTTFLEPPDDGITPGVATNFSLSPLGLKHSCQQARQASSYPTA
jgi:hypothetical protein